MMTFFKHHWFSLILVVIIIFLLKSNLPKTLSSQTLPSAGFGMADTKIAVSNMMYRAPIAPSESADRLIIQDTNLSLQVNDVSSVIKSIDSLTKGLGGFLVNSNLTKPDTSASGSITVRIPEAQLSNALDGFKKLAVKVVSESVTGSDVTDSYVDLQAQLDVLTKTKTKYEEILNKAVNVQDLLSVQQQLTSLQQQIDSIKGQQKYYEQSAKLSKVTVYLSTDELALPYAPTNEWRPAVIFKDAVRSLVGFFRGFAGLLIWAVVYSPIIIAIIGLIWFIKGRQSKLK